MSVSSQSTYSLASSKSNARASGTRVRRDVADARRVLRVIKQVKEGTYKPKRGGPGGKYLIERTLHYSGYKIFREELRKAENRELLDYVDGGPLRFDYTRRPCQGDKQFVIHLPSAFHEGMAGRVSDRIVRWLGDINNGKLCRVESCKEETMRIAGAINSTLATRVKYSEPRDDQLEPDLSFMHEDSLVAGLVVEVAWSQSNLKLPDRAKRYIEGTSGEIRTVVGLNMNDIYLGRRHATLSVWKAEKDQNKWRATSVENKEFLNRDGEPINGYDLLLSLKDFICAEQAGEFGDFEDIPLKITSTELHNFGQMAFRGHMVSKATDGIKKVTKQVNDALGDILRIEETIREQRTEDPRGRTVMGGKELADVRAMILEVENKIGEMKSTMTSMKEKMDKVTGRISRLEEKRIEAENGVAELETKLANVKVEEEKIVERKSRVRSALGLSLKN
ncbi:hypothetical protein SAMD00023353_0503060 [Rosellinia necatrix]|uniref:Uncharacterized protein n=1 Tax=Rosellinia necatrix TaxID=77044 RepID=A0A1S7UKR5_ROSNE|nr:hypothetical protein SAMD00023353_0503060 [Rosellinia necatrix]